MKFIKNREPAAKGNKVRITLNDGIRIFGTYVEREGRSIFYKDKDGTLYSVACRHIASFDILQ